jgi:acyl-CoA-binding protein
MPLCYCLLHHVLREQVDPLSRQPSKVVAILALDFLFKKITKKKTNEARGKNKIIEKKKWNTFHYMKKRRRRK